MMSVAKNTRAHLAMFVASDAHFALCRLVCSIIYLAYKVLTTISPLQMSDLVVQPRSKGVFVRPDFPDIFAAAKTACGKIATF